jgi:hypothetical protein
MQFSFEQSLEKKKEKKKFSEFTQLSHKKNNTPVNEEAQNTFLLLTRAALTTNTILILTL